MSETPAALETLLGATSSPVRRTLEACLAGRELSWQDALETLCGARGLDLQALALTADALRREQVGDVVTYVINRNINFTNVCVMGCKFCAFSRDLRSEQGYLLDLAEIVRRAVEAQAMGASEVCLQAGLAPDVSGQHYIDMVRAVAEAAPGLHIHALSPEEVRYGAKLAKASIRDYLAELKAAGLGSLPGTSAEILDDALRDRISPGRISTAQWLEVIRTAHELGLPTTATMMFGHLETAAHRVRHLALLRDLQQETGGFTEFVPLSFVHAEAPLFARRDDGAVQPGPTGHDVVRLIALSRLMLGATFKNLQTSWVKEGLPMAQWLLACGANDLGGTLMNESITTTAGGTNGQLVRPAELRRVIRDAGRVPAERTARYTLRRTFDRLEAPDEAAGDPLEAVTDAEATFGSYAQLAADERHRYRPRGAAAGPARATGG
jgi:FO synthase subunit 2